MPRNSAKTVDSDVILALQPDCHQLAGEKKLAILYAKFHVILFYLITFLKNKICCVPLLCMENRGGGGRFLCSQECASEALYLVSPTNVATRARAALGLSAKKVLNNQTSKSNIPFTCITPKGRNLQYSRCHNIRIMFFNHSCEFTQVL